MYPATGVASQEALVVKNLPANVGDARDAGLIPGSGGSPGGGHGNPLQFSCLENPKDRGAWRATAHQIMSQTQLKWLSIHACMHAVSGVPFCYKPTKIEDMKAEITKHKRSFSKDLKVLRKLSFSCEGMSQVRMDWLCSLRNYLRDFPGSPVVKTPCSPCWRHRFHPWLGN